MAANTRVDPFHSMATLSLSHHSQSNPIDLTLDDDRDDSVDDYGPPRLPKRPRTDFIPSSQLDVPINPSIYHNGGGPPNLPFLSYEQSASTIPPPNSFMFQPPQVHPHPPQPAVIHPYRPNFAGPSQMQFLQQHIQPPPSSPSPSLSSNLSARTSFSSSSDPHVIDLTGSPSPPPPSPAGPVLPNDLPPNTPVCIGLLSITALVLYHVPYLCPTYQNSSESEWAPVRLQYEFSPNRTSGPHTIHIKLPQPIVPNTEVAGDDSFAVVEQRIAAALGPLFGRGLIRFDAKIRRSVHSVHTLPLQMLVYTPKGNIPVVGNFLFREGLLLDHPAPPFQCRMECHYFNPHNPPPGGHNRALLNPNRIASVPQPVDRWTTPTSGKSVEVQRSQVDDLFRSLKSGDELSETEPPVEVGTKLYPHQKKALTFLLDREREKPGANGSFSDLWQARRNSLTRSPLWYHIVTQKEMSTEPPQCKGAILADDMGLGKTITCVSLIAATLESATVFASSPLAPIPPRPEQTITLSASHFAGSVWGMPDATENSARGKAKIAKEQSKQDAEFARASRIKAKSRATLVICPLSTVANWEDQFREHWRGAVHVVGGSTSNSLPCRPERLPSSLHPFPDADPNSESTPNRTKPLRVYVYHGNARRPEPEFLVDFDAVITTYATLASEFSKQNRSIANAEADDDDDDGSSDGGVFDLDEPGNQIQRIFKGRKAGLKRKKSSALFLGAPECTSPLQSIHWFRVVLDEAHSIKETSTVGSRACCDLMADRRLCLTGTPVQNKLDDVFALIRFLRLHPFDDKAIWTEFIGTPVKYGQALGVARLQMIMKCITLRRTKESKSLDGKRILSLPPRRDELRYLKFDEQERAIYDNFFNESKAEFKQLSHNNEVMKNYVGILQKILRLRQICDHFELVKGKRPLGDQDSAPTYEDIVAAITKEGINAARALAIFALLRESGTTQCVECGVELGNPSDASDNVNLMDIDTPLAAKRSRKPKASSHSSTRASSPNQSHPVLTRCQHLFCLECYRNCICQGWPNVSPDTRRPCSACQTELSVSDTVEVKPDQNPESLKKKPPKREKRQKGLPLDNFNPSTKVKALLGDLIQSSKQNPYSANYDPDSVEIQSVDNHGNDLGDDVVKTVVFSQWTSMLDKVEDALEAAGIRYDRLDGTMKRDDRSRAMDALKHDPGCEVLLVSLKAGGVGLNLTAAQRVYLMDPYWNPAVENQAVDRIHRLGQTRPVSTIKLIIENSIEARLLEVQKKKTELANMTLGQSFSKADMLQRRLEELNQLFG